jgi:hypothetical protein
LPIDNFKKEKCLVESKMKLIETISFNEICDLIEKAEEHLYISLPSIDGEIAHALIQFNKSDIARIVIDNSEEAIRNGFSETKGIDSLREKKFQISQLDGNLISFIISDETDYFQKRIRSNDRGFDDNA